MIGSALCALAGVAEVRAVDAPSFYRDVLPILQDECQVCHREGGSNLGGMIAPMAFADYSQVRPWSRAIARKVGTREMPPWHASPRHAGVFENERTLTEDQIDTIVRWVESGSPPGDLADAPPAREWGSHEGWSMGEPDLMIEMPEPYLVADDVEDLYIDFPMSITEEMLSEPRWVRAVEVRPGSGGVHHIVGYPVGSLVPGGGPTVYREGLGVPLEPGTRGVWGMHYHKEPGAGTAFWDQSKAAVWFHPKDAKMTHVLRHGCLCDFDFAIPAGDPHHEVETEFTFQRDSRIVDILPHMHLRGKAVKIEAFYPDGTSEILLDVPRYDFNWQTTYLFKEFKFVPAGTRLVGTHVFDNSPDNPSNPDPTVEVSFGRPTTAEMVKSPFTYIHAVDEEDVEAEMAWRREKARAGKDAGEKSGRQGAAGKKAAGKKIVQGAAGKKR